GRDNIDHLVDHDTLAGGSAGMHAIIAIGVIGAILEEHADLVFAGHHNPAFSIPEIDGLGDKTFGHASSKKLSSDQVPQEAAFGRLIAQVMAVCPSNFGGGGCDTG